MYFALIHFFQDAGTATATAAGDFVPIFKVS